MEIKRAMDLVIDAKGRIENLTAEQLSKELEAGDVVLFDLREQNERELHGVIPGAIHAPRGMLEFWADPTMPMHRPEFDPSRRMVLHCAAGGRSALAADTLTQMGYRNVAHLEGGFEGWKTAGGAVASADQSPEAAAH
ncbi:MAG TPA: rhodanese-like domain-containing protein [Acidimicrobiales bacterium]|nr:rhodanese-like domain-containing protein [Acidimicrobiales bacterium]